MENIRNKILVALLIAAGLTLPIQAKMATMDEALNVASNWIELVIQKKGGWGDANDAFVQDIQEFKQGQRTIGYFCNVNPVGCIIVSLRKELAPIKAYSARCNLDPTSNEGMADLIKGKMEEILNVIEQQAGPIQTARTEDVGRLVEINYSNAWAELEGDISTVQWDLDSDEGDIGAANYQEGDIMLTTNWHQGDPYNQDCPAPPGGDDCTSAHCVVGCVATAGAQVMRYWYWPPYGSGSPYNDTYDWPNMPDSVTAGSPAAERNAVAELSHEIGVAVGMGYCLGTSSPCASTANTYDMEDVYEDHYRYSTACSRKNRPDYSAVDWFNLMKADFNANRVIQYRIKGHSIVGDGWQEIGGGPTRQYHMNYGWSGTGDDIWYTLDALYQPGGGTTSDEYMLENIYPAQSLHSSLAGTYTKPTFVYRYFNVDATGSSVTFEPGQYLQFLPGVTVTSTGTIRFDGSSTSSTRLFSRGDTARGARIYGGTIKMSANGSVKLN
jgi:hypothetical protein